MQSKQYGHIDPLFLTVARISTYDEVEMGRLWAAQELSTDSCDKREGKGSKSTNIVRNVLTSYAEPSSFSIVLTLSSSRKSHLLIDMKLVRRAFDWLVIVLSTRSDEIL
jgi:hypothetical protein